MPEDKSIEKLDKRFEKGGMDREIRPEDKFEKPVEQEIPFEEAVGEGKGDEGISGAVSKTKKTDADDMTMHPVRVKEIEHILEEKFDEIYKKLPPELKYEFKQKGEEAARRIDQVLSSAKVTAKSILGIIKEWLLSLKKVPGIDKFFLEQQAKIKTDKIISDYKNKEQ